MRSFWHGMLLWVLLLSGCITQPPPIPERKPDALQQHLATLQGIQQFHFKSRLSVQTQDRRFTGKMEWLHQGDQDHVTVYSPLNTIVARLDAQPGLFTVTNAKGKQYTTTNLEELLQNKLGWVLPLQHLVRWSLGKPATQHYQIPQWDAQGRILTLQEAGWTVWYQSYQPVQDKTLPQKLSLSQDKLTLTLLIDRWDQLLTQP